MAPRSWLSYAAATAVTAFALGAAGCMNCPKPAPQQRAAPAAYVAPAPMSGGPAMIRLTPENDVNPVKTQHIFVATVLDSGGNPVSGAEVEWILGRSGAMAVGDIVDVDGGNKIDNSYAKSVTGSSSYTIDRGNADASDDVAIGPGQTWCVITATDAGSSRMIAYAPSIANWDNHKAFATKNWMDVNWEAPMSATNRIGTPHTFAFRVFRHSDGAPLSGVNVNWTVVSGPGARLNSEGRTAATKTDSAGWAKVVLTQETPTPGVNEIQFTAVRPAMKDECVCWPEAMLGTWTVTKTWIAPSIAIAKSAPIRETIGHSFAYDIQVTNTSPDLDVKDVVVTDPLPSGVAYESSDPPAEVSGNNLTWRLGGMGAGASRSLRVFVHGTQSGMVENCATVTAEGGLTARACAPTTFSAPALQITKSAPATASMCDPITYTITVTNSGDGEATNVRLVDTMPAGITTGDSTDWMIGTLGAHETRTVTINGRAAQAGNWTNRATVTADGGLSASAEATTNVMKCTLSITKSAPGDRRFGRPLPYDITVTNTGQATANNVVIEDPLPAEVTFQSATMNGMLSGNTVVWNLGTLRPGETRGVSVNTIVSSNTEGVVRNTAMARGDCCDQVQASAETKISGVAAILLECIDIDDPIEVGATETYVIDVTNQGNSPDRNVVIKCDLPPQEDYVSAEGPNGTRHTVNGKSIVFDTYPSLPPRQNAPQNKITYRVVVKGNAPGDVRFHVALTSDMLQSPVEETESTHIY